MPIHHTVLIKLIPGITAAQKTAFHAIVVEKLKNTPGSNFAAGPPLFTERAGGYDYGISRIFADEAQFQEYRVHPDHVSLVQGALAESAESLVSFQIQS